MRTTRKLGLMCLTAFLGVAVCAGPALASPLNHVVSSSGAGVDDGGSGSGGGGSGSGTGRLRVTGSCGDVLDLRVKQVGDGITVTITIPSADPSEVWGLTAIEQQYGPVTGGRIGDPVNLVPTTLPALAFSTVEGGFSTTGEVPNTTALTHGFSYVATRSSGNPITCTNQGFWTNPGGTSAGPTAENPTGRPDTAPALTGATEADSGTNAIALQFDQEMLDTMQGTPDVSRFAVTVDGVSRTVTGVSVVDDSPPAQAIVDVTFDGAALTAGQTVAVQYRQPLTSGQPALQDPRA